MRKSEHVGTPDEESLLVMHWIEDECPYCSTDTLWKYNDAHIYCCLCEGWWDSTPEPVPPPAVDLSALHAVQQQMISRSQFLQAMQSSRQTLGYRFPDFL